MEKRREKVILYRKERDRRREREKERERDGGKVK